MRCRECNVDLSEEYRVCPLCGAVASDDEPRIKNIKAAPYPANAPVQPEDRVKKPETRFTTEKIKAMFNL